MLLPWQIAPTLSSHGLHGPSCFGSPLPYLTQPCHRRLRVSSRGFVLPFPSAWIFSFFGRAKPFSLCRNSVVPKIFEQSTAARPLKNQERLYGISSKPHLRTRNHKRTRFTEGSSICHDHCQCAVTRNSPNLPVFRMSLLPLDFLRVSRSSNTSEKR